MSVTPPPASAGERVQSRTAARGPGPGLRSGRADRTAILLRRLGWSVIVVGLLVALALPGDADQMPVSVVVLVTLVVFFLTLVTRLLLALGGGVRRPAPRRFLALLMLAAGIGLWSLGSGVLAASSTVDAVAFPSPSEVLFLAAYACLAGFVVTETPWADSRRTRVVLEAAVLVASGVCLAAFAVLTPARLLFAADGVGLVLAVLWPLLDGLFVVLVVSQAVIGRRERSRRTVMLVVGFLLLLGADALFLVQMSGGSYEMNLLADLGWGCGFGLLVDAATRPPRAVTRPRGGGRRPLVMLVASAGALAVLLVSPTGVVGWTTKIPAAVTLACAGALLATSLREANRSAEAFRLSRTDDLTGLPNRRAVLADLAARIEQGGPLAFLLLDLDGFKDINDSLGHGVGDDVLRILATRLRDEARADVRVYRLGGDEFAVIVDDDEDLRLHEVAEQVREALGAPLTASGLEVVVRASVGIAVRGASDDQATDLVRRADVAMYEAKSTRAGVLLYEAAQDGFSRERLQLTEGLRHALTDDQLELWFQPQVHARTRQVIGLEALLRWRHPDLGVLTPVHFLGQARQSGLMPQISDVVLQQATTAAAGWAASGLRLRVSFNCAPPELQNTAFLRRVAEAVAAAGLPRESMLVEVTEDSFLADPHTARERLLSLRDDGVQIAIDDYGTGFSSLAYLRDLPVQELKIDRSFVATLRSDRRSRVIVQTTTQMAHALGLRVVAEGVEDERTARELTALEVDVLQGYGIARPMPGPDVLAWVRAWTPQPAPTTRV